MKHFISFLILIVLLSLSAQAAIRTVDPKGGAQYTSIRAALQDADAGDIIRLAPGTYDKEQITVDKDVTIQGSGAKVTVITGNFDPVITQKAGIIKWVTVISKSGDGINMSANAMITNLVAKDCKAAGISILSNTCKVNNCLATNNGIGIYIEYTAVKSIIINCISYNNTSNYGAGGLWNYPISRYCSAFGTGGGNWSNCINCLTSDPMINTDYRLDNLKSPCVNGGDPTIFDWDGTISDMGYYGGPDAPMQPYISLPASFKLNDDGTMQFKLKGRVGY
ncbi:MAG: Cell surface glycoprotein with copper-binding domain [Ignavibacteria bacterium]|nr:Cell surface glycoprotein with copper-binding domain [Ignavibacteria bacterium]